MGRKVAAVVVALAAGLAGLGATPAPAGAAAAAPIGALDGMTGRFGNPLEGQDLMVEFSGWAAKPGAPGQRVRVDLLVDGTPFVSATTGAPRPDVGRALPWAGPATGWRISLSLEQIPGTQICAYGIGGTGAPNGLLGCRNLSQPNPNDPIVSLEAVISAPGHVRVRGWVGDPDGYRTTRLRIYYSGVDKPMLETVAELPRPDVKRAFPKLSATTGFDVSLPIEPGPAGICILAQNTGPAGLSVPVGCVTGRVPNAEPPGPHDPRGMLEDPHIGEFCLLVAACRWYATGWAYDPDTAGPISIRVRALGINFYPSTFTNTSRLNQVMLPTGTQRDDVLIDVPPAGPNAGFDGFAVQTNGYGHVRLVCAWAKNVGPGKDRLIGCYSRYSFR